MFLEQTVKRNPELVRLAFSLHRQGIIEPDSYLIDVDTFCKMRRKCWSAPGKMA